MAEEIDMLTHAKEEQLEMQDCYHKAESGEPKFTLLARDPVGAGLVELWAALRKFDLADAAYHFAHLCNQSEKYCQDNPTQTSKLDNAEEIAGLMHLWRGKNR